MVPFAARVRPYRDDADLRRMLDLVRAAAAEGVQRTYYQLGDVVWRLFQHPPAVFDPREHLFLWEDPQGSLLGVADLDAAAGTLIVQLDATVRASTAAPELLDSILGWAETHLGGPSLYAGSVAQAAADLTVDTLEDDALYGDALARRGYERQATSLLIFHQPLETAIAPAALPPGWTLRSMAELSADDELAARVELHREVWQPSKVTLDAYRRLRQAPVYRPDLDLVAVSPEGVFAAYCICWLDEANHTGEFEPVGARPAFRRRGLTREVLLEGCRRLQAHGATLAVVYTNAADHPPKFVAAAARGLYEASGFSMINRITPYRKDVRAPTSMPG